ncbi:MAG: HesA/MoeB/ThiF family protein [Thiohalospira sp.]
MDRYVRHATLLGKDKFTKIADSVVLVAGAGGLGCTVLDLLARIGIGTIHFYEYATIDAPDLNRQILYTPEHLGQQKCSVAATRLNTINPDIRIVSHIEKITKDTQIPDVDLVFDCLDNFTGRYILSDMAYNQKTALIHAGVSRHFGQITTIVPGKTPTLKTLFPLDPEEFDAKAVKEIMPHVVTTLASLQVAQGISYLLNDYDALLLGKMLSVDLATFSFDIIPIS